MHSVDDVAAMTITRAAPGDTLAIKALVESAYRGDAARAGWTHEADLLDDERITLAELNALLGDPAVTLLVARGENAPVGCVALTRKDAGLGYIGMLCVAPGLQSGGLGRQLLEAAEDLARGEGIAALEMTVIDSREALIAWYERRGYVRTGETRPFPSLRDPPLTFVVLVKRLAPA